MVDILKVPRVKREVQKIETGSISVYTSSFGAEKEKREEIEVGKFLTEPAYIRVNAGKTVNLGQYESFRIDVSITVPCYIEEIETVQPRVSDMVARMLEDEMVAYDLVKREEIKK